MSTHQIQFVNKVPRQDIHHAIKSVGGYNPNGSVWKLPLADAVKAILESKYKFFVAVGSKSTWVTVAKSAAGHLYLKTEADATRVDNLLYLPEFP